MLRGPIRFTNGVDGTADFVYPGPAIDMQSPATAGAVNGATYVYYAQSLDMTEWEVGSTVYNSGTGTFARTSVAANSLGTTAKIDFSDPPQIFVFDTATQFLTQAAADLRYLKLSDVGQPGQCKFVYVGTNQCLLRPWNGSLLKINGGLYQIPNAGVSINTAGMVVGTLYFVYAYISGGSIALELSTTGYQTSTTAGNAGTVIKSGDDTRTLVGMVMSNGGFVNSLNIVLVRSWFNEAGITFDGGSGSNVNITSVGTWVEIHSNARCYLLLWYGENVVMAVSSALTHAVGNVNYLACGWSTNGNLVTPAFTNLPASTNAFHYPSTTGYYSTISHPGGFVASVDGLIVLTAMAQVSAGTGNYQYPNTYGSTQRR